MSSNGVMSLYERKQREGGEREREREGEREGRTDIDIDKESTT